jgi:hypothetical protein
MFKTVRGAVNINYCGHVMFKTVRGAVNINYTVLNIKCPQ